MQVGELEPTGASAYVHARLVLAAKLFSGFPASISRNCGV